MNTTFNFPVPSPDSEDNYATLKGVDFDSDGIRDDIQRSIINFTGKNTEFKTDLEELARVYQRLMETEDNTRSVGKVYGDLLLKKECMKKAHDATIVEELDSQIKSLYFNSMDRSVKLIKINDLLLEDVLNKDYSKEECR